MAMRFSVWLLAGSTVCVSQVAFAGDEARPRDFDDRSRRGFGWELGIGPWGGLADDTRLARTYMLGAAIDVGVHTVHEKREAYSSHSEKGFDFPTFEGLRWCAGIGCGFPLLLAFAPAESIVGNEVGVDVRVVASPEGRVVMRPILRYASGRFRTSTLASLFLPEMGFTWSSAQRPSGLVFAWSPEAFDMLVDGRHLVVGFEPFRMGFVVPLDRGSVFVEAGATITLRWIR